MFREIELHPSERDFHRFLLRQNGKLVDCRMKRLTFGVASSPFLATQVLRQLAENKQAEFPTASAVVKESFYVDDCLVGAHSVQDAAELWEQLSQLLETAGMKLRKWRSNSKDLLSSIPEDLCEKSDLDIVDPSSSSKALGLHWHVETDQLYVPVPELLADLKITKRFIASVTAKIFDVMGFFAPSVLQAKLILQKLWSLHVKWDTEVPEDIKTQWTEWTSQLQIIANCPIPRTFTQHDRSILFQQLHGFSDASSVAYGGVVYLRTVFDDTRVEVTLVTSKSRVAPLKTVTIPRLELVAVVLTAKLLTAVANDLRIPMSSIWAWTDSTIVLHWLKKPPNNLPTFVSNRVVQAVDLVPLPQWRYVPTSENPADLSSRGVSPETLVKSLLWWNGPPWLSKSPDSWPMLSKTTVEKKETDAPPILNIVSHETNELWHRYSQFSKLVRIVAWCRRLINNCSHNPNKVVEQNLTHQEVNNAHILLFALSQRESFAEVFDLLRQKKSLPRSHSLSRFTLQLSEDGLIRVCSRVRDDLHPQQPRLYILLSITSPLTQLFVTSLHNDLGHPGTSTLLATIAEDYYMPRIKPFLKSLSRRCVICQKAYLKTSNQQMGMLPLDRTRPSSPFERVGLDFAGPFFIRRGNPRKPTRVKVYACVFVCLSTRAIHLELCSDLSSEAFMATFQRFCARRGTPSHVFSDNGTNFVGTRNELSEVLDLLESQATRNRIAHLPNHIQWNFAPARTPHFGGLWESGVRAMKTLLRKNLKPHLLTFEELNTVFIQAEAILNSRPIVPLETTEADGLTSLTAGHFLIGRPLIAPPTNASNTTNISILKRWNLVERLNADLWTQWRHRYLQSLHSRTKWRHPKRNFRVGDIVLVKDETLVQRTWPMGKIVDAHPGDDGLVRVVKILCNGKTYTRSINRLVLLVGNNQPSARPPVCPGSPGQRQES